MHGAFLKEAIVRAFGAEALALGYQRSKGLWVRRRVLGLGFRV